MSEMIVEQSDHRLSTHTECLNSLCRLCGRRSKTAKQRNKPAVTCFSVASDISKVYNVNVLEDKEGVHSNTVCSRCTIKMYSLQKRTYTAAAKASVQAEVDKTSQLWHQFDPSVSVSQCGICAHFQEQTTGGRPENRRKRFAPKQPSQPAKRQCQSKSDLDSDLSFSVPSEATSTPAKDAGAVSVRTVSSDADKSLSPTKQVSFSIPSDHDTASSVLPKVTSTPQKGPIAASAQSVPTGTDKASSPFKKRILRRLNQLKAPLTDVEETYLTKLIRIKLSQSSDKTTVTCKTGGQPIVLKKITKPRKASTAARTPLRRKRAKEMDKIRLNVSGDTEQDAAKQQGTELRTANKARKQLVLSEAGCSQVSITARQGVALRAALGISLTKYRLQKQFYRRFGIQFASEQKERNEQLKALCAEVEGQMRSLEVWNEIDGVMELIPTPSAGIKDVPAFVSKLLDAYDSQGRLTWHEGSIPQNEIWIKIGGDHGGGSFKMMLQIANLINANSKHNTCIFTIVECKDTPENLRRVLDPFRDQIDDLQTMEWRGKQTRLFLFGDYDFQTKMYGLSGAQGIHPCLYCTTTRTQMQLPPETNDGNVSLRTLHQIKRDCQKFKRAGNNKTNAKLYNNVIRKPVLDIDLEQVTPPYLHILLGVVKKHHEMLEKECHDLDKDVARTFASMEWLDDVTLDKFDMVSAQFRQYVKCIRPMEKKKKLLKQLQVSAKRENTKELEERIKKTKEEMERMESAVTPLTLRSGPVTENLENVLRENKIFPQAYHSRAFVGNHCNKYLKEAVYKSICQSVADKVAEIYSSGIAKKRAKNIVDKFTDLNAHLSDVHQRISHQRAICEDDMEGIQASIGRYMSFFRTKFPKTAIIPKQHLLEHHCVPWIRRWGTGMALLGEQGGEETHATINALLRRVWGLKNKQQQLKVLLTEHLTQVSPFFHGLIRLPQKKKTQD